MGDLSPHFSRREFRCRGEGKPGHPAHDVVVDGHLVEHLEQLRRPDAPLRIVSGHRCQWWNRHPDVNGAANSRHVVGDAADIPEGYATTAQAEAAGFTGIGSKGRWAIHVDVRPGRARWTY